MDLDTPPAAADQRAAQAASGRESGGPPGPLEAPRRLRGVRLNDIWSLITAAIILALILSGIFGLSHPYSVTYNGQLFLLLGAGGAIFLAISKLRGVDVESDRTRRVVDAEAAGPTLVFNGEMSGEVRILPPENDASAAAASAGIRRQEAILREIYTQGLAQAKISFTVSIIFATVGASLLFLGVGLAVTRATTDGDRYASIVAGLAGTVINLTSGLFFLQSNRARANMVSQGTLLREESQEDRRTTTARELVAAIGEPGLRDKLRSELARALVLPLQGKEPATEAEHGSIGQDEKAAS